MSLSHTSQLPGRRTGGTSYCRYCLPGDIFVRPTLPLQWKHRRCMPRWRALCVHIIMTHVHITQWVWSLLTKRGMPELAACVRVWTVGSCAGLARSCNWTITSTNKLATFLAIFLWANLTPEYPVLAFEVSKNHHNSRTKLHFANPPRKRDFIPIEALTCTWN